MIWSCHELSRKGCGYTFFASIMEKKKMMMTTTMVRWSYKSYTWLWVKIASTCFYILYSTFILLTVLG